MSKSIDENNCTDPVAPDDRPRAICPALGAFTGPLGFYLDNNRMHSK